MSDTDTFGAICNALDAAEKRGERIVRLEIGRLQAAALAAAYGRKPLGRPPTDAEIMAELYTGVPIPDDGPYTIDDVYSPPDDNTRVVTFYGVPMVGVGVSRLVVVTEPPSE
jgi:hypothetical protein